MTSAMADQAIDAMDRAAENVRAANHATLHRGDFDHHDLYRLMGEVSTLVQRLPQLLDQTAGILDHLHQTERIDIDSGSLDDVMVAWRDETTASVRAASELALHVDRSFAQLSGIRASDSEPG